MTTQPEALRLADWLDGSSNGPMDARHQAAAELRRLHEENRRLSEIVSLWVKFDVIGERITLKDRIAALEQALGMAVEALGKARSEFDGLPRSIGYDFDHIPAIDAAIATARQTLGGKQ